MKAKNLTNKLPTQKQSLNDKLPLNTPYIIQIFPIYACNLKCRYCIFSVPKNKRGFISDTSILDFDLYKKSVDDMGEFEDKMKVVRWVGIGEPLLHKNISEMVKYTVDKDVTERTEIITNGVLLNKNISNKLIDSGLTRLVISLQGVEEGSYKEVSDVDINFSQFINNLEYLYNNKGDMDIYIKVMDTSLRNKKDEEKFYSLFGNISDSCAIEKTVPIHEGIQYNETLESNTTQFGTEILEEGICTQSFIHIQINPDGKIVPCYSWSYPLILGDVKNESLYNIWNGKKMNNFRVGILKDKDRNEVCKKCSMFKYRMSKEDILSEETKSQLINYYGGSKNGKKL
jgi:radical SAM protein with 4Fe4S-binding SPASM domain